MGLKKRSEFKWLFKLLVLVGLFVLFGLFFLKEQVSAFFENRSTISSRYEKAEEVEFPTITVCLDPATKLSFSQTYGFTQFTDKFTNQVPNSTLVEVFDNLTYKLNKDFQLDFYKGEKISDELISVEERYGKRKLNIAIKPIRTLFYGTCYSLVPQESITYAPIRFEFAISINPKLEEMNRPESVVLHFTSNKSWIGVVDDDWPQFKPLTLLVNLEKEYTHLYLNLVEKHFERGIENAKQCITDLFSTFNCSYQCSLLSYTYLPLCQTTEQLQCMWNEFFASDWSHYEKCYLTKKATTYELKQRIENPLHTKANRSLTRIYIALWSMEIQIQEEVPLLTTEDFIGSIGGSLGMFFGFSMSATLFICLDKVYHQLFY